MVWPLFLFKHPFIPSIFKVGNFFIYHDFSDCSLKMKNFNCLQPLQCFGSAINPTWVQLILLYLWYEDGTIEMEHPVHEWVWHNVKISVMPKFERRGAEGSKKQKLFFFESIDKEIQSCITYSKISLSGQLRVVLWSFSSFSPGKGTALPLSPLHIAPGSWNLICIFGRDHRWCASYRV